MRRVYGTKVARLTLGKLPSCLVLAASQVVGKGRQRSAEAIVAAPSGEGPNMQCRMEVGLSMVTGDAAYGDEIPRTRAESSGRKPRGQDAGASNTTARPEPSQPEVEMLVSFLDQHRPLNHAT